MRFDHNHIASYRTLAESAPAIAAQNCGSRFSGELSCEWYHSIWPLLRLLDAVSTPYWHKDFYDFAVRDACTNQNLNAPKVGVVGAADFAMSAIIKEAIPQLDFNLLVIDQCATALQFNKMWALENHTQFDVRQASIFDLHDSELLLDIAISDAFLTRFQPEDRPKVLKSISKILVPGGVFITTIRDHSRPILLTEGVERLISTSGLTTYGKRALSNTGIDSTQMKEIEHRVIAYCERMHSFPVKGIDDVLDMCRNTEFKIKYVESSVTPGEFFPTTYMRLIFERQ